MKIKTMESRVGGSATGSSIVEKETECDDEHDSSMGEYVTG